MNLRIALSFRWFQCSFGKASTNTRRCRLYRHQQMSRREVPREICDFFGAPIQGRHLAMLRIGCADYDPRHDIPARPPGRFPRDRVPHPLIRHTGDAILMAAKVG
jgi:hypothetical protein